MFIVNYIAYPVRSSFSLHRLPGALVVGYPSNDDIEHRLLGDSDVLVIDPFNEFIFLEQEKIFAFDHDLHKVSAHKLFGLFFHPRQVEFFGQEPDGDAGKSGDVVLEKGDAVLFEFREEKVVGDLVNSAQIRGGNDDFAGIKKSEDLVDRGGAEGGRERHPRFGVLREPGVFEESLEVVRPGGQYAFVGVQHGIALDHDRHVAKMLILAHRVETGQRARSVTFVLNFPFTILRKPGDTKS